MDAKIGLVYVMYIYIYPYIRVCIVFRAWVFTIRVV